MVNKFYLTLLTFCLLSIFLPAQTLTTVFPDTAVQGQTLILAISGQNTSFTAATHGPPIHVSWLTRGNSTIQSYYNSVQSNLLLKSTYHIPGTAAVGYWDVHANDKTGEHIKLDGLFIDMFVGIDPSGKQIRNTIKMAPNPMVNQFVMEYEIDRKATVAIDIMDLHGRLIRRLIEEKQIPGSHRKNLSLEDINLPSGMFLIVLRVDEMAFATKATRLQ
ncbi:MAG TPA: hypothetical protein ENJ82_03700 [Bacteroidetes bacterium]|nr:hypothetical protein [Bacteroidota bacterium]